MTSSVVQIDIHTVRCYFYSLDNSNDFYLNNFNKLL